MTARTRTRAQMEATRMLSSMHTLLPNLLCKEMIETPQAQQIDLLDRFYHVSDRELSPTSDVFSISSTPMWEPKF